MEKSYCGANTQGESATAHGQAQASIANWYSGKGCRTFVAHLADGGYGREARSMPVQESQARFTSHYLVSMVQFAYEALEDGKTADFLVVEYSKGFDKVDTSLALHKLLQMGVRGELMP